MSSIATSFPAPPPGGDDALSLLPRTPIREYRKGEIIYRPEDLAESLYLVVDGRVKISRLPEGRREVVLAFLEKEDFFGEAGFGGGRCGEQAEAIEKTALMQWPIAEIRRLMARSPALASALLRVLALKLEESHARIESLCLDPIHRRLAKSLLEMARRACRPAGGVWHAPPTTHEQLARYVGTSREIITQSMNQFRRLRLLQYSRKGLEVDLAALERHLKNL